MSVVLALRVLAGTVMILCTYLLPSKCLDIYGVCFQWGRIRTVADGACRFCWWALYIACSRAFLRLSGVWCGIDRVVPGQNWSVSGSMLKVLAEGESEYRWQRAVVGALRGVQWTIRSNGKEAFRAS